MDEVAATYTLLKFLEKLRISGHIKAHTEQTDEHDGGDIFGDYQTFHFKCTD